MTETKMGSALVGALALGSRPRESMTDQAYRAIEEQIVTFTLAPGQVLSENALAGALGMGRTPVREALQRLAREGLVLVLPRRGIMVSDIDVRKQLELLRVRRVVEALMAGLCAQRANAAERERFLQIAHALRACAASDDATGFIRLDRELNLLMARTCRNEMAQRTMGLMQGSSRRFWTLHYRQFSELERCATLHAELSEAIGQASVAQAERASDELLSYVESYTRGALDAAL